MSNFEIHSALFAPIDGEKLYEYYRDPEKRLLGDGYEKHFCPEDFYLYLTAHEYKHYSSEGTGLRSLLDIYVYLQKQDPDMSYVEAEAEKMGVPDFEAANRSLAQRLFSGGELTEADRKMLDSILSSGVYGSLDGRVKIRLAESGNSKIRYAWERFIEPINKDGRYYQAFVEEFPFFYRHKILLPVLMVYRVFLRLKSGRVQREFKSLKNNKAKSV